MDFESAMIRYMADVAKQMKSLAASVKVLSDEVIAMREAEEAQEADNDAQTGAYPDYDPD